MLLSDCVYQESLPSLEDKCAEQIRQAEERD